MKYAINLHKGATAFFVTALMFYFHNFSVAAFVYLALHGSYGFLWLLKDQLFPDKQWEEQVSIPYALLAFSALGLYWIAPVYIVYYKVEPSAALIGAAVAMNIFGTVLHFGSDAQKYFTLMHKRGLITEGFFSRTRNPNYLGELMIYVSFAMLTASWIGYVGITLFFVFVFIPNMLKKDKSISRHPEFAEYKKKSGLLLPTFW